MPPITSRILQFPEGLSPATSGVLVEKGRTLITGHSNGYVARWSLGSTSQPVIILRAASTVYALASFPEGGLFVGSQAGDLHLVENVAVPIPSRILTPTNSKQDRVWRVAAPSRDAVVVSSNYGVLKLLQKRGSGDWVPTPLVGHNDAIFALDYSPSGWLASGDYRGNILAWTKEGDSFKLQQRLRLDSYVSGLAFLGSDLLGAVGLSGGITIFNFQSRSNEWLPVFQTNAATGGGQSATPTLDGKQLLAVTADEIIGVDPESQQVNSVSVEGAFGVFPHGDDMLVLTSSGLLSMKASSLAPLLDLVRYNYVKVALLGHTGFGKSTLCSTLTTGHPGEQTSTFGRRVWTLVTKTDPPQRRVLLNDNGGQERVVASLLPLMADSDLVLYFFKQTDRRGFTTALDIQRKLQPRLTSTTKQLLVETFTDQPVKEITDKHIQEKINELKLDGVIKVFPKSPVEVLRFRKELEARIDWEHSHTAAQSEVVDRVLGTIGALRKQGHPTTNVDEIAKLTKEASGNPIYLKHLRFVLQNLSDSGEIEYNPTIDKDLVVLDDPVFNELRTNIPVYVGEHRGIIQMAEIEKAFNDNPTFVAMLDRFYTSTGIAIETGDGKRRVFPPYLDDDRHVDLSELRPLFETGPKAIELEFQVQDFDLARLIRALIDLRLDCIDATQTEGLFSWGSRAYLYYHVNFMDRAVGGRRLRFGYSVRGSDTEAQTGLRSQLLNLLGSLYGMAVSSPTAEEKKRSKHEIDVALTYATEQIEYVRRVDEELSRSGVRVFFDKDHETELWGEDLIVYLDRVFRELSTLCVMFISDDYIRKLWPRHERRSALARQMEQEESYILPVRFDNAIVPGLSTSIKYVRAEENTPAQLAERIRAKLQHARE
jgi:GTPase SAR1 family protein